MTHYVHFFAERALLAFVRDALDGEEIGLPDGSVCILACQAAFESIVNSLLKEMNYLSHWNELRLRSKVDTIAESANEQIDWGSKPWQKVTRLNQVRNWLAHNKEVQIGLKGAEDTWVEDYRGRTQPRVNIETEFTSTSIRAYYEAVREAAQVLADLPAARIATSIYRMKDLSRSSCVNCPLSIHLLNDTPIFWRNASQSAKPDLSTPPASSLPPSLHSFWAKESSFEPVPLLRLLSWHRFMS